MLQTEWRAVLRASTSRGLQPWCQLKRNAPQQTLLNSMQNIVACCRGNMREQVEKQMQENGQRKVRRSKHGDSVKQASFDFGDKLRTSGRQTATYPKTC